MLSSFAPEGQLREITGSDWDLCAQSSLSNRSTSKSSLPLIISLSAGEPLPPATLAGTAIWRLSSGLLAVRIKGICGQVLSAGALLNVQALNSTIDQSANEEIDVFAQSRSDSSKQVLLEQRRRMIEVVAVKDSSVESALGLNSSNGDEKVVKDSDVADGGATRFERLFGGEDDGDSAAVLIGIEAKDVLEYNSTHPAFAARLYLAAAQQASARLRMLPHRAASNGNSTPGTAKKNSATGSSTFSSSPVSSSSKHICKGVPLVAFHRVQRSPAGKTTSLANGTGELAIFPDHFEHTTVCFGLRSKKSWDNIHAIECELEKEGVLLIKSSGTDKEHRLRFLKKPKEAQTALDNIRERQKEGEAVRRLSASSHVHTGANNVVDEMATKRQWLAILEHAKMVSYPAGEVICREGESLHRLFQISAGSAKVAAGKAGNEITELGTGEMFGEMSLVEGRVASATVSAGAQGCEAFVIEAAALAKQLFGADVTGTQQTDVAPEHARFCRYLFNVLRSRVEAQEARLIGV